MCPSMVVVMDGLSLIVAVTVSHREALCEPLAPLKEVQKTEQAQSSAKLRGLAAKNQMEVISYLDHGQPRRENAWTTF